MGEVELLLLLSISVASSSGSECVGEGGTTTQRVVTFTLPLARFFTSHKSVSFFFIVGTLSTVDTVGSDESFDLLDCILIDLLSCVLEFFRTGKKVFRCCEFHEGLIIFRLFSLCICVVIDTEIMPKMFVDDTEKLLQYLKIQAEFYVSICKANRFLSS